MGASRILSAKKHFEKVSKYSALLYASSAHTSFPHPSFRDSIRWYKAGFLSRVGPLGCGRLFFIRCCAVCFGCLRKRRWKFAPFSDYRQNEKQIPSSRSVALLQSRPACHNPRIPSCWENQLSVHYLHLQSAMPQLNPNSRNCSL